MFEKNLKLAYLLDFYGDVLDDHTRSVMKAYYDDDLSLSEIADGEGISRQGVRHIVKKGEEELSFLEDRLGLAEHYEKLNDAGKMLRKVRKMISSGSDNSEEMIKTLNEVEDIIINK